MCDKSILILVFFCEKFDIFVAPTTDRAPTTFWSSSTTDRGSCRGVYRITLRAIQEGRDSTVNDLFSSLGYTSSSAAAVVAGSIGCGCMCVNAEAQQARVGSDGLHVRIPELALLLQKGQRGTHLALNTACRSQVSFRRFPPSAETVDSWSCFARIISVLFFQGGGGLVSQYPPTVSQYPSILGRPNFRGLVLGCIEADLCK